MGLIAVHYIRQVTWLPFASVSKSSIVLIYSFICLSQLFIPSESASISCSERSSDGQWKVFGKSFAVDTVLSCLCSNDGNNDTVTSWIHPDTKMASVEYNIKDSNITFRYTPSQYSDAFVMVHITCIAWNANNNETSVIDRKLNMKVPLSPSEPTYITDESEAWLLVIAITLGALSFILLVVFVILCFVVSRSKRRLQGELLKQKTSISKGRPQSEDYVQRSHSDRKVNQSLTITISPKASLDSFGLDNERGGTTPGDSSDHCVSVKISDACKVPKGDGIDPYHQTMPAIRGRANSNEAFKHGISIGELKQDSRFYKDGSSPPKLDMKLSLELPPRDMTNRYNTPITTQRYERNTIGRGSMVDAMRRNESSLKTMTLPMAPYRNRIQSTPEKPSFHRNDGRAARGDLPPTVPPRNFMSLPRPATRRELSSKGASAAPW